ncbi:MAG: hypothetical protein M3Z46_03890 [Actinomycetota bacterium]|nr:hypothetical protein [Actinomycetota bacterium]
MNAHGLRRSLTGRLRQDDAGQVGGVEVLPFGLLIFVVGSLLIANAWSVIDAKMAVTGAAREATRAYVEAPDRDAAEASAKRAAEDSIRGHGRNPNRLRLSNNSPQFVRCERVEYEARYTVPALSLPFIGGFGHGFTVTGRHSEIIDPFANGRSPESRCGF